MLNKKIFMNYKKITLFIILFPNIAMANNDFTNLNCEMNYDIYAKALGFSFLAYKNKDKVFKKDNQIIIESTSIPTNFFLNDVMKAPIVERKLLLENEKIIQKKEKFNFLKEKNQIENYEYSVDYKSNIIKVIKKSYINSNDIKKIEFEENVDNFLIDSISFPYLGILDLIPKNKSKVSVLSKNSIYLASVDYKENEYSYISEKNQAIVKLNNKLFPHEFSFKNSEGSIIGKLIKIECN